MHLLTCFTIITIAFLCSSVWGNDVENRAAYERVVECILINTHADQPGQNLPTETVICDAFKAMYPCITRPFNSTLGSSEILDFYRAYHLQRVLLTRKSNLCKEPLLYEKLKMVVDESGIMKKENLHSIEYDPYVECAGRVSRTCYTEAKKFWDDRSNILDVFLTYIDCYGEKTPECNGASIAEHMNDIIQAFGRHLEEKKGLLGQMIKNIDHSYN